MHSTLAARFYLAKHHFTDQEECAWLKGCFEHLWRHGVRFSSGPSGATWQDGSSLVTPALVWELARQRPVRLDSLLQGGLLAIEDVEFGAFELVRGQAEVNHALYYLEQSKDSATSHEQRREALIQAQYAEQHARLTFATLQGYNQSHTRLTYNTDLAGDGLASCDRCEEQIKQMLRSEA